MNLFLTVFVPAYNEQTNLENNIGLIAGKLSALKVPAEIIIVDDASTDRTPEVSDCLQAKFPEVRAIHHPQNLGIGGGFLTAVREARGEWMILIPADLAMDINELKTYLDHTEEADVIVGLRSNRSDYSALRKIVSWLNIQAVRLLFGMKLHQFQYISMYRLDFLRSIKISCWRSAFFLPEILIKARDQGRRLVEVEICYAPRVSGKATGAKLVLIVKTARDMFLFWLGRLFEHRNKVDLEI